MVNFECLYNDIRGQAIYQDSTRAIQFAFTFYRVLKAKLVVYDPPNSPRDHHS